MSTLQKAVLISGKENRYGCFRFQLDTKRVVLCDTNPPLWEPTEKRSALFFHSCYMQGYCCCLPVFLHIQCRIQSLMDFLKLSFLLLKLLWWRDGVFCVQFRKGTALGKS